MTAGKIECADGTGLSYVFTPGDSPTTVFLTGFASDMTGGKAIHLERLCQASGRAFLRFDYQGHGTSDGEFSEGTIGRWAEDALHVVESTTEGPLVLVGSSMGGWIMVLLARRIPDRVAGLVGIASAPDFTEDCMPKRMSPTQVETLKRDGYLNMPSDYSDEPTTLTKRLLEEARGHLVLRSPIDLQCPVRLIHGLEDQDIPWETSLRLAEQLASDDVRITLVKGGGHRLSEPAELDLIGRTVEELCLTVSR